MTEIWAQVEETEQALLRAERDFERWAGEVKAVATQTKAATAEAKDLSEAIEALEEASALLNSYADERQEEVRKRLEVIVTHGLQTIFGEDITFHVEQKLVAKRTEIEFLLRSPGPDGTVVETSVMDARGGGVAAIVGFLVRVVIVMLKKDARKILFLDETFAHLSAEFEPRLAEFIKELVEKTSVQIVMVTHSLSYSDDADVVYRFSQSGGVTTAEALS